MTGKVDRTASEMWFDHVTCVPNLVSVPSLFPRSLVFSELDVFASRTRCIPETMATDTTLKRIDSDVVFDQRGFRRQNHLRMGRVHLFGRNSSGQSDEPPKKIYSR